MTKVRLFIKDHACRMDVIEALQTAGYECKNEYHTEYMSPRTYVVFEVEDYDVEVQNDNK